MTTLAAAVFLAILVPACLYAAWSDLRSMTIPNAVPLGLAAAFLVAGPLLLPLGDLPWRFGIAAIGLFAGFLLNQTGQFGAGDAKLFAAVFLYIAPRDLPSYFILYAAITLVSVAILTAIKFAVPTRAAASGFRSLRERRRFPLGLPIALAAIAHAGLVLAVHLARS